MATGTEGIQERLVAALGDRYLVEGLLDVGGAALVFRARDQKHGRLVAVKVLKPELTATVGAQRFLQEIRISANLSHPNILPLHDSGEAGGLLFYVMPFVEGESLRDHLSEKGRLPDREVLRITQEVARGLAYAHAHGVTHRDVKPENVLMSGGVAVVADFGIARAIEVAGSAGLTQPGTAPSTPRYASPEQLWDQGEVDHRTDQYSLACIVFEMLTGRTPFEGSGAAVASRKLTQAPPRMAEFRPDLPEEVGAALERALSGDPTERFPDIASFEEAFQIAIGGGRPRGRRAAWGRWLVGAAVAAVAGGVLYGTLRHPVDALPGDREDAVLAVLPFEHVGSPESHYFTDGMTDEVATRIGQMPDLSVVSLASSRFYDSRVHSLDQIGGELGATHVLMGSIRIDQSGGAGRVRFTPRLVRVADGRELWASTLDTDLRAGQIFDVQASVAEEVARALNLVLSPHPADEDRRPTESLEAYGYFLRASPLDAQLLVAEDTRRSIEMYERAVALDPTFARAYAGLGRAQSLYYYFFDRTSERYEAARDAVERAAELAPDDPETRIAQGYLAYWGRLDYRAAMDAFMAAGAATSSSSELLWVLASVQRRQGDYEEALRTFRRGARLDPRSPLNTFEVGGTLVMLRRFEEAMPYARRARALAPNWLPTALAEPVLLVYSGRADEARAFLDALAATEDERRRFLPQLVEDVIYRPFWDLALGAPYQETLETATSDGFADPVAYFVTRIGRARRVGAEATLRAFADSAVQVLNRRLDARPGDTWARIDLATALALAGRRADGQARLRGMEATALIAQDAFRGPFWVLELARAQVWLGDEAGAVESLQALQSVPSPASGAFLLADPALSRLAGDPRFEALVTRFSSPVR